MFSSGKAAFRAFDFLCRLAYDARLSTIVLNCKPAGVDGTATFVPGDAAAQEWIAARMGKRIDVTTGTASGQIRLISIAVPRIALGQVLAFNPAPSIVAETPADYAVAWRMHAPQSPARAIEISHRFAEALGGKPLGFTFPVPGPANVTLVRHMIGPDHWAIVMPEADSAAAEDSGSLVIPAMSIKAKPVNWLWPDVIAFSEPGPGGGAYFLLAGAEKMGKSTIAAQIGAIVTRGGTWPTGEQAPCGPIAICEKEDSASTTTIPRMQATGADMSKVSIIKPCDVSVDMDKLARDLEHIHDLKLLILSPWVDCFGKSDTRNDAVRAKVRPLQDWAAQRSVAVLGIIHLADKDGKDAMALTGSAAWKQAARGIWSLVFDPDDNNPVPYDRRRLMVCGGTNVGTGKLRLPYTIEAAVTPEGLSSSRVVFAAAGQRSDVPTRGIPASEVCEWLMCQLSDGPRDATDLKSAASKSGISLPGLYRAAKILGVERGEVEGRSAKMWTYQR
jgi:putative DNA primase/helicase